MGDLRVIYDDDVNGAKIHMEKDDEMMLCNHIIVKETIISR